MKEMWVTAFISLIAYSIVSADIYSALPELTLKKVSKNSLIDQDKISYELLISSDEAISDIYTLTLTLKKESEAIETIYENYGIDEILALIDTAVLYNISSHGLDQALSILITVHDKDRNTLAFLQQGLLGQDISPTMTWVGLERGQNHKDTLRIATNIDLVINDEECKKASSPWYSFNYESGESVEVCIQAKDDTGQLINVQQCDRTLTIVNSPELELVSSVQLLYPEVSNSYPSMTISAEYNDNSTHLEGVFHDGKTMKITSKCDISSGDTNTIKNCYFEDLNINIPVVNFTIVIVALGEQDKVIESTSFNFEDYKTEVQALTKDIMEVRWNAATEDEHKIYLNTPANEPYKEVLLSCGGNNNTYCKSYFVGLENSTYLASVKKSDKEPGNKNIVGAYIDMARLDNVAPLTITKFTEMTKNNFTITLKASKYEVMGVYKIVLAIVNSENTSAAAAEFVNILEKYDATISKKEKDFNFIINREHLINKESVYVIVTAHGLMDNDHAKGVAMIETSFQAILYPTVNEVGTINSPWIRVKTDDMELEINGKLFPKKQTTYIAGTEDFETPLTVCREAGKNLDDTPMRQCDQTKNVLPLVELASVNSVQLSYPEDPSEKQSMTFSAEYREVSTTMEGYFNDKNEKLQKILTCDLTDGGATNHNCTIIGLAIPKDLINFSIVMVAINETGEVVESSSINFEDYKTNAEFILTGMMQASWNTVESTEFLVYLDRVIPDVPSQYLATCGDDVPGECLVFFQNLPNSNYVFSVKKNSQGGELNIVGIDVTSQFPEEEPMV